MIDWILGCLGILGTTAIVVAGVYIVRSRPWYTSLDSHNDYLNYIYAVIGLMYGVFLAFTTIAVWEVFSDAEKSVVTEVSDISLLWRNAEALPLETRDSLQKHILEYCNAVVEDEWKTMAQYHIKSIKADQAAEHLWKDVYACRPDSSIQSQTFYEHTVATLNSFSQHRRQRLMYSRSELPGVLWVFLIVGAAITLMYPYLFYTTHPRLQALALGVLSILICASMFLSFSLQHPFSGEVSVKPDAFEVLIANLHSRQSEHGSSDSNLQYR
jgi:predicted membrane chloride channel (bestrophin family)